jgi:hypothetical protein
MLGECQALFLNCLLQVHVPDWHPDPIRGYSVRGGYQLLTSQQLDTMVAAEELMWHKQEPGRCLFLLGDFYEIGCPLELIWQLAASSLQKLICACQVAVVWNLPNICSYHAISLAHFGL